MVTDDTATIREALHTLYVNGLRRWIAGRLYLLADKTDAPPPFFTDNFERADETPLGPSWEPPVRGWIRDNRSTEASRWCTPTWTPGWTPHPCECEALCVCDGEES